MKENTLVKVDWIDSSTTRGWHSREDAKNPDHTGIACVSVGFVVRDTKENITVCGTIGQDGDCLDAITIPRGCIKTRVRKNNA